MSQHQKGLYFEFGPHFSTEINQIHALNPLSIFVMVFVCDLAIDKNHVFVRCSSLSHLPKRWGQVNTCADGYLITPKTLRVRGRFEKTSTQM